MIGCQRSNSETPVTLFAPLAPVLITLENVLDLRFIYFNYFVVPCFEFQNLLLTWLILKVNEMIDDIQSSFIDAVEKTSWIDTKTKSAIKEKVLFIKRRIGFPEWILDPTEVDDYYEQVCC